MLFWVLSSQSFMRISRAGQDDGDVGAPIMQTVIVHIVDLRKYRITSIVECSLKYNATVLYLNEK